MLDSLNLDSLPSFGVMVLTKCVRVSWKFKPRSVLMESRDVPDHALLFESDVIAILSKLNEMQSCLYCGVTVSVVR